MTGLVIALIMMLSVFMIVSYKYELYKIEYNPLKGSHNAVIYLCVGLCVGVASVIFYALAKESIAYPLASGVERYNAYVQQFDAFLKHRISLDIVPDSKLAVMSNPYDYDLRADMLVDYLWDRAYYKSSYYSYFGIAPILTVYFPFYLITGKIPDSSTVCYILSVVSVVATAFVVLKLQKIFIKRVRLISLALSIFACEFAGLIFMVQASADMYYTAVASGIAFVSLFFLFTLSAYDEKRSKMRCLFFALSAVSLVLTVLSRPNLAVYFLIAIPVYLSTVFSKDFSKSSKISQVLSFAVPTVAGAVFVMWYNYVRFDSIFEFGAKYQLTVHDVSEYAITPLLILPTLKYYFFQMPVFSSESPYFDIPFSPLHGYDKYLYITSTVGIMAFPVNWSVALSPLLINKKTDKVKLSMFIISVASILAVAFSDMCLAGVNIRYNADIALVSILVSTTVISKLSDDLSSDNKKLQFGYFAITTTMMLCTIAVGIFLTFINERNNLLNIIS